LWPGPLARCGHGATRQAAGGGRGTGRVPIAWAIGGTLALALAFAAAVTIAGLHFLHFHRLKPEPELSAGNLYNLLKVAFAFAAGIGGVFALVTAYRRQRVAEFAQELADRAEDREAARLFNERFGETAGQLGHDNAAVRLAGVYAMARLADDWPAQRQTCVDVLCAYLRMPYQPDPGPDAPPADQQDYRSLREVRHTVIRVITAHLQPGNSRTPTAQDWRGLSLDFTGTVFDGGNFGGAEFTGGEVRFGGARFGGGEVSFGGAEFTGGEVRFGGARFGGGRVRFGLAEFAGGEVGFDSAQFTGGRVSFHGAEFTGGRVGFGRARFGGGAVSFGSAQFAGGAVSFGSARFAGGAVDFSDAGHWSAPPSGIDWNNPTPRGVVAPGTGTAGTGANASGP
jgi:Pentapeptide repeats (9 copies)